MSNQNPTPLEAALIRMLTDSMPEQLGQARVANIMDGILDDHRRRSYDQRSFSMAEVPTKKGTGGWAEEVLLRSPPGQDLIEKLVDQALPHGNQNRKKE